MVGNGGELNYIIINPWAGKGRGRQIVGRLREALDLIGVPYEIAVTGGPGRARNLALEACQRPEVGVVVAAGGDGTYFEVVNGLAEAKACGAVEQPPCLALLPLGTGNDLARSLGYPLDPFEAVGVLETGIRRPLDIGREREAYFAVICATGFPAEVMRYANLYAGPIRGPLAITRAVFGALAHLEARPLSLRYETDEGIIERDVRAAGVFIMNTPYTGGGLHVAPQARTDDGLFDVLIMGNMDRLDLMCTLPRAYRGRHLGHPKVNLTRARAVTVTSTRRAVKMYDGTVQGHLPLEARVLPAYLEVLTPAGARPR